MSANIILATNLILFLQRRHKYVDYYLPNLHHTIIKLLSHKSVCCNRDELKKGKKKFFFH